MAFGGTREDRVNEASVALALKLKLEKPLSVNLMRIFKGIERDFRAFYNTTGQVIDANLFNDEIGAALRQAYNSADRATSGRITDFARENPDDPFSLGLAALAGLHNLSVSEQLAVLDDQSRIAVREFIDNSVDFSVPKIANTTNGNLADDVRRANEELIKQGKPITPFNTSVEASKLFDKRIPGRVSGIASTEIQNAVEGIQSIEARTVVEGARDITLMGRGSVRQFKEWVTMGDEVVRQERFNHVLADSQQVPVDEPFIVSGESLMFPGDRSLGASIGNIANCRCHQENVIDIDLNQLQ